jgi:hypothetical protein
MGHFPDLLSRKMPKRRQRSNSPLHSVDHLIKRLQGPDSIRAMQDILATPEELLRWYQPLIPLLIDIGQGLAVQAACLIGPETGPDFVRISVPLRRCRISIESDTIE